VSRIVIVIGALAVVAGGVLVLALSLGEYRVPPGDVIAVLFGGGDRGAAFVIEKLRLPRAVDGLLAGAALGVSGAVFQSLTRNPLGSPDVIGLTAGSSAAAVAQILVFGGGAAAIAGGAVVGGTVTAALVYLLAFRGHGMQTYRLVLIGIGAGAMLQAITNYLLTRARLDDARGAQVWLTGSLNGRGWPDVRPLALGALVLLPLIAVLGRELRMLELGDEVARSLGVAVERARALLIAAGVGLAALATAAVGPILFVALAAPQLARRLTHESGPGVWAAGAMGAVLLAGSDVLGQHVFATELPTGIITGTLGGLYLLWLLAREWRATA
jgi:iron complex transport system permease protein